MGATTRAELVNSSVRPRPQTVKRKEFSYASLQIPVPIAKRVSESDILAKAIKDFQKLRFKKSDSPVVFKFMIGSLFWKHEKATQKCNPDHSSEISH